MFKWLYKKKGCAKHMNNKLEVIGIDHGWSMMKTISQVFVTGVKEITTTPALFGDVLEYEGKFYKVGTVRQEVKDTKVEDDSFYLLTLAAVAKELKRRGLAEAKVFLAVGLPLTRFGAEKNDFIKYLTKNKRVKLALFGIKTIGDLARADEDVLNSHLGKMGSILWSFANGYDDSSVKLENTHAPIKSVGNSTTTPKDMVCDEDVKIVLYILAESVAARLRENGFRCRVVEISVRDNELFSFTRQKKIDHATNITGEIAAYAYQIFKENYNWSKPIRSVGVRGADLVTDNYWEQIDLFSSVEKREKQMKMDSAVDEIRKRFGFYSIQRGLMYRDRSLSAVNAKEEHTVHPHGYFSG